MQVLKDFERNYRPEMEAHPELWRSCYPRRIQTPHGYSNPKMFSARCFQALGGYTIFHDEVAEFQFTTIARRLIEYRFPTYFIEPEFCEAVWQSPSPEKLDTVS